MSALLKPIANSSDDDAHAEIPTAETSPAHAPPEPAAPVQSPPDQSAATRDLFRVEVLAAKQQQWLGQILLARPISFSLLSAFAIVVATAVILFLVFGEYTRKERVTGQVARDGQLSLLTPTVEPQSSASAAGRPISR
jgi:hypothetical protein